MGTNFVVNFQPKETPVICVKYGSCEGFKTLKKRIITLIDKNNKDIGEYCLVHIIGHVGM